MPFNVDQYLKDGYRIAHQDSERIQLIRPKKFSFGWAIFWFLFLGVGLLVYVLYYMAKKDDVLVIDLKNEKSDGYCCGRSYDKTWKICLTCQKPLSFQ